MPLTDSYGQGVPYPTLTDKPNAQTLGEGIVQNIVPRTVMVFPSAVVRGGTISKPAAGMVTWLADVGRLEVFDGSAWVAFGYGTNAWRNVPLSSGWTNNGNDQGNFQYRVVNLFGEATIMFRGGIARPSYPGTIPEWFQLNSTPLAEAYRPSTLRTIVVPVSNVGSTRLTMKLDIRTDGYLRLYGVNSIDKPAWVGFNGCWSSL